MPPIPLLRKHGVIFCKKKKSLSDPIRFLDADEVIKFSLNFSSLNLAPS